MTLEEKRRVLRREWPHKLHAPDFWRMGESEIGNALEDLAVLFPDCAVKIKAEIY